MFMKKMIVKNAQQQHQELLEWLVHHEKEVAFPKDVKLIKDVPYIDDQKSCHLMDIYQPTNQDQTLPVIINIHGGGLLLGSKEVNRLFCAHLCTLGFIVFCVEYPLIPDVDVYQQYHCIHRAIDKIDSLLDVYQGDRHHVYLTGDSAGAYLAVYVTAMQKSDTLCQCAHVQPSHLPIQALGLMSGMFYTTKKDKIGLCLPSYIYGHHFRHHPFYPFTNPEHLEIITNLPPCFLVTSQHDYLQHYTLQYYQALKSHHIPSQLINYPKNDQLVHAFVALNPEYKESQEAIDKMIQFFKNK